MKPDREYRLMDMNAVQGENDSPTYIVRGYASTYEPYTLFEHDGVQYKEQILPTAFNNADMSDVVFRVDHEGPVYARTSAGTVSVWPDDHGLAQETNLGLTQRGRDLFADIAAGNYPKMSFAFKVAPGGDHFDRHTHTRIIERIAKVFDVSPVVFPSNPGTELCISTRNYFNGVIEAERAERLEAKKREAHKLKIKLLLED